MYTSLAIITERKGKILPERDAGAGLMLFAISQHVTAKHTEIIHILCQSVQLTVSRRRYAMSIVEKYPLIYLEIMGAPSNLVYNHQFFFSSKSNPGDCCLCSANRDSHASHGADLQKGKRNRGYRLRNKESFSNLKGNRGEMVAVLRELIGGMRCVGSWRSGARSI